MVHERILPALRRVISLSVGPRSQTGTPATPTRRSGNASSSAIARSSMPSWPSGLRTMASGQWSVASKCGGSGEWRERTDQFCSVDQGIFGHLTLRNLAALAEERGDRAEARRLWKMVLDVCPGDAEATSRGEATQ